MARSISGKSRKGGRGETESARALSQNPSDIDETRQKILTYLADNPDKASKRDIAKAFGLKGADRVWLKDVLRDMQDDGLLEKTRKNLSRPGTLPTIAVLEIFKRDGDGGLLARSVQSENGDGVLVSIRQPRNQKGTAAGIGDRVLAKTFRNKSEEGPVYTARVIKVLDRRDGAVLGVLRAARDGSFRLEPVERRQAELVIEAEHAGDAKPGDLVEVQASKSGRYGLARGKVLSVIGAMTSEKALSMIAIHAHEIPHVFPTQVLTEANELLPMTMSGREDWRDVPLVTIDPADAKDHDDAIYAKADDDEKNVGGVVAWVAIADVAAYVKPASALDREALRRGNSVYFPDRVVPMLPERISNDLCSLRENVERPAMAVRMTFDAQGRKIRHSFHRVMMKSAAKLAYEQAQAAIDGQLDDKTSALIDNVLKPLWSAYDVLKRGRASRAPLELDLPERKIMLKPDGTVDRVVVPERLEAHKLVEEFMIQANVCAAETLEQKKQPLVYRIHDAPSLAKQETLREFLATIGMSLARGPQLKPAMMNSILERVSGEDNESLVNQVVLRSQSQAEYSPANIGHFGLNLQRYAHFTSPIRRYSDLIVHRALISALALGSDGLTDEEETRLEETSALISSTERRAMAAERDTIDRLVASYLAERIDDAFDARISGVTKAGLFVELPQFGADGFIPVSSLDGDYYIYDETRHALIGERTRKGYQLADRVEVKLLEVAPLAGAMRFEMLAEPKPLPGSVKSFNKSRSYKGRMRATSGRERARSRRR